jgi:hypothetical protein
VEGFTRKCVAAERLHGGCLSGSLV